MSDRRFQDKSMTLKLDDIWKLLNERLKPAENQEYLLGVSYKEALGAVTRSVNGLYDVISVLQNRVLELEKYVEESKCDDKIYL